MQAPLNEKSFEVGHYSIRGHRNCDQAREALNLSNREFQILQLMAIGKTGRQIAGILGVSDSTADTFRRRAYQKLGVNSAAEAVAIVSAYLAGCTLERVDIAA